MIELVNFKKLAAATVSAALLLSLATPIRAAAENDETKEQKPFFSDYYGDINLDGVVTSDDALAILRMSMLETCDMPDEWTFKHADVDFDNSITATDALKVLRESVGFDELSVKYFDTTEEIIPNPNSDIDGSDVGDSDYRSSDIEDDDTSIGESDSDISSDETDPSETDPDIPDTSSDKPKRDHSKSVMDDKVIDGVNDFAVKLFSNLTNGSDENSFVSPISVYTALAMLNNGAAGNTRNEIMSSLGFTESDDMPVMNESLNKYITSIDGGSFTMANSMFVMEDSGIKIKPEYEQLLREMYSAEMFNEPANNETVDLINKWISDKTDSMLNNVLPYNSLTGYTASVLINAAKFDAEWGNDYSTEYGDYTAEFNNFDGTTTEAKMLVCTERSYLDDGRATGFVKDYTRFTSMEGDYFKVFDEDYIFIAILPNEDVGIDNYLATMDGNTIRNLLNTERDVKTYTLMPKFRYKCKYDLVDPLKKMGVRDVFNAGKSDLSETCEDYPLFVSNITHDTFVEVNESGTKAAAATVIYEEIGSAPEDPEETKSVYCDRPYIYVIYDNKNDIPLFIGTIKTMEDVEIPEVDRSGYYDDWDEFW